MANKPMKGYSTSLVIRNIQIKIIDHLDLPVGQQSKIFMMPGVGKFVKFYTVLVKFKLVQQL